MSAATLLTRSDYDVAFEAELGEVYPVVDALELRHGYGLVRDRLDAAARVLACPVKTNPPNWQHGRVIYAVTRAYLEGATHDVTLVDVGTAKGFSALCLLWAMQDAGCRGRVISVDVIDPMARVRRNTVAEVDGYRTLAETLAPWPESQAIEFRQQTGVDLLESDRGRGGR